MKTLLAIMCISSILSADVTTKCLACHGLNFEKVALGKSKVVKDMTSEDISKSLQGYQKGEGGPMKGIMIAQVKGLTEKDIKEISSKASSLKK
jgi:cytochrome c